MFIESAAPRSTSRRISILADRLFDETGKALEVAMGCRFHAPSKFVAQAGVLRDG
jgi:hypothetical protein